MRPSDLKSFRSSLESIRAELASLRLQLQEHGRSVKDRDQAHEDQQKAIVSALVRIRVPDDERIEEKRAKERYHGENLAEQRRLRWWTSAAFIAAAIYATIAYCQWRTTNKTYIEIQKQTAAARDAAKAAQQQTTLLRAQLEGTMAAVVEMGVGIQEAGNIEIIFSNTGHVTARDIHGYGEWRMIEIPSGRLIGGIHRFNLNPIDLAPNQNNPRPPNITFAFTKEEQEKLQNAKLSVKVAAHVTYLDGFNDVPRPLDGCKMYLTLRFGTNILANDNLDCDAFRQRYSTLMQQAEQERQRENQKH